MDASGNFVLAWESLGNNGRYNIFAQRFDSGGLPLGNQFQINNSTANDRRFPVVAMSATGYFVIAWQSHNQDGDGWGVYARQYDNTGTALATEFSVNTTTAGQQRFPCVDMDHSGRFAVVWESDFDIKAQRYDASGIAQGGELSVKGSIPSPNSD